MVVVGEPVAGGNLTFIKGSKGTMDWFGLTLAQWYYVDTVATETGFIPYGLRTQMEFPGGLFGEELYHHE